MTGLDGRVRQTDVEFNSHLLLHCFLFTWSPSIHPPHPSYPPSVSSKTIFKFKTFIRRNLHISECKLFFINILIDLTGISQLSSSVRSRTVSGVSYEISHSWFNLIWDIYPVWKDMMCSSIDSDRFACISYFMGLD